MTGHDDNVDWSRVQQLREDGSTAADALEQARSEQDEQGGRIESPPDLGLDDDDAAIGRTCASIETISWVASQLRRQAPDVASAPSEAALALLQWATSSPVARAEFWKNLWSRTLPTRAEIENQARYADDGSTEIELAQRIMARLEAQTAEDECQRLRGVDGHD